MDTPNNGMTALHETLLASAVVPVRVGSTSAIVSGICQVGCLRTTEGQCYRVSGEIQNKIMLFQKVNP